MTGSDPRSIGVGVLGHAFMGRAHSNAYRKLAYVAWPPSLHPELVTISGQNERQVAEAARRFGFVGYTTDWREQVTDDRIQLFDNCGPNYLHAEPTIAAAEAGKHVLCEKPLGRTAAESYEMWKRVEKTGSKHMCGFNYRFLPATRLARELIDDGQIGAVYHFRSKWLQDLGFNIGGPRSWRHDKSLAGAGALVGLGSHIIDMARYLVGEPHAVSAATRTFVKERAGSAVDVDDAFEALLEFETGAVGTIEASRFCLGHKNTFTWEINGSLGTIKFNLARLNELQVYTTAPALGKAQGPRTISVTDDTHPFLEGWWPSGTTIGWEDSFTFQIRYLLGAIYGNHNVAPIGATFEDGYRASEISDAIITSADSRDRVTVEYRV